MTRASSRNSSKISSLRDQVEKREIYCHLHVTLNYTVIIILLYNMLSDLCCSVLVIQKDLYLVAVNSISIILLYLSSIDGF